MTFGYTAKEMLGSRFRRLIPPDIDAEEELGRIAREVREKGAWIWEKDLVEMRLRSLVRYHPLSGLYELHNIDSDSRATRASPASFALETKPCRAGTTRISPGRR